MEPITRKEMFLAKASGQLVDTPDPITREEMFLQKIAENGSGSGGGGTPNAVQYTAQELTEEQQMQARANLGLYRKEGTPIDPYFDNDLTGREVLPMSATVNLVKITDYVLTEEECVGAEMTVVHGANTTEGTVTNGVADSSETFGIPCFVVWPDVAVGSLAGSPTVAVVKEAGVVQGLSVSAGTYYLSALEDGEPLYTSYFSALVGKGESIHKIPQEFLDLSTVEQNLTEMQGAIETATPLIVTVTGTDTLTADKDVNAVYAAASAGRAVFLNHGERRATLVFYKKQGFTYKVRFTCIDENTLYTYAVSGSTVTLTETALAAATT